MASFYINSDLLSEGNVLAVLVNIPLDSGHPSGVPRPIMSALPGDRLHDARLGLTKGLGSQKHWRLWGNCMMYANPSKDFEKC